MIIANWQAVLTFALVLFLLLPLGRLTAGYRLAVFLAAVLVALVPLSTGLTLAGLLRGLTDDLAMTSLVWLSVSALVKLNYLPRMPLAAKWPLWLCFALLGLVLYPAALGLGMVDTYRWGYSPRMLIIVIATLTVLLVLLRSVLGVLMLALATVAFVVDLKPSDNYWDYLLDPFIVIYSLVAPLAALLRRRGVAKPAG
jgi:asparagine N-glycosylation enzyme membrane subunit Stt3